jgi:hypothetical protein
MTQSLANSQSSPVNALAARSSTRSEGSSISLTALIVASVTVTDLKSYSRVPSSGRTSFSDSRKSENSGRLRSVHSLCCSVDSSSHNQSLLTCSNGYVIDLCCGRSGALPLQGLF